MLHGFPHRPLSYPEVESLNHADAIGFVCPATPNSIRNDDENQPHVYDLLITTGETVSAVVYAEDEGWIVVGKTDTDRPKETLVNDVIAYRKYDIEDEQKVLDFVSELYEAMNTVADE